MSRSQELGTEKISRLLVKMAVPASIGILVMFIYFIVDTIFVGRFVGSLGIAAISVVMPITILISSSGMAIGVGGASVISRALGAGDLVKARSTFGNMATLTLLLSITLVVVGSFFEESILRAFGANGDILQPAKDYFNILLVAVPCLAWAMMSNNVMRAEGRPKIAMISMMVPAVVNLILDPIFIVGLDMGLKGAAWATTISYFMSAGFTLWYFFSGRSELKRWWLLMRLKVQIVREIVSIGAVTLARQGSVSLLSLVLNHSLFHYGGESAVAVYGIINRVVMFSNFPVLGITQGFLPIAGYNYGAGQWLRVRQTIRISIRAGSMIAVVFFVLILLFPSALVGVFTTDPELMALTPRALTIVVLAMPLITTQLISTAYFQAIGRAVPALLLTLTKQGFFLIPLVLLLPLFFNLDGIWIAFPIADVMAAGISYWFLQKAIKKAQLTHSEVPMVVEHV